MHEFDGDWARQALSKLQPKEFSSTGIYRIGLATDVNEIEKVSHVSCLEHDSRQAYEKIIESENIFYVLFNSEEEDNKFNGYSRAYTLKKETGDIIYGVAATYHEHDSPIPELRSLGVAAHFLNAKDKDVDYFAVPGIEPSPLYSDFYDVGTKFVENARFRDKPVKDNWALN